VFSILTPDQFQTSTWKNGGGVTHEIARQDLGDGWLCRISLAEVSSDGPFSLFPGMFRILTIVEGEGLDISAPQGVIAARPHLPVRFSGEVPVASKMLRGPVRNLNLIYDAKAIYAEVRPVLGPDTVYTSTGKVGFLCLSRRVTIGGDKVPVGAFALGSGCEIQLDAAASGILVSLQDLA